LSSTGTAAATGDTGAAAAAQAAAAAAATAQAAASNAAPWFDTMKTDAEFVGTLQTRGLDKKTALEAAHDFYKGHREATQMISRLTGTPDKDRIVIRPKPDATPEEITAFHEKLGRPAKADDYDYKDVKFPDGTELDADYAAHLRAAAFKANLTKDQAASIAKDQAAYIQKIDEARTVVDQAKLSEEIRAIEAAWGPNHDAFLFIAKQAMTKFGFTPDMLQTLQKTIGASKVMDGFLKLGQQTGEGRFIANQAPGGTGLMTPEQATAKVKELMSEKGPDSFGAKVRRGDVAATEQYNALAEMITPRGT
jgi:hypothetical protein